MHKSIRVTVALAALLGLAACDSSQPMTRTGEVLDHAGSVAGNTVGDAGRATRDALGDAGHATGNALNDAGSFVKQNVGP